MTRIARHHATPEGRTGGVAHMLAAMTSDSAAGRRARPAPTGETHHHRHGPGLRRKHLVAVELGHRPAIRATRKHTTSAVRPMAAPANTAKRSGISTRRWRCSPDFYQAYANRALIHRYPRRPGKRARPTTTARIQLNPSYDAAYIGRGNLYRKAGRTQEAFNDFQKAIQLDTTDPRATTIAA